MQKIRVVFMGTPSYATKILEALVKEENIELCALFTQPDKPAGRGKMITPPHIKTFVIDNNLPIPIFQPQTIKDSSTIHTIKELKPHFIIVAAYGKILPKEILDIAPCINLHASLLPKYRGASPIQYAILNDDLYSGVTAMRMEEGLDCGDILGLSYINSNDVDLNTLFENLSNEAAKLTIKVLNNFHIILPLKQSDADTSYAPKITKEDGLFDFSYKCKDLYQRLLAFSPWPGLYLSNGIKLKAFTYKTLNHHYEFGSIIEIRDHNIDIACKDGVITLERINPPSKKEMSAADYVRGKRIEIGNKIF